MGIEVGTDANALDVIAEVRQVLENQIFPQLPEGMQGDIPTTAPTTFRTPSTRW